MLADIMLAGAEKSTASVIVWSCVMVLVLVAGYATVMHIRKRMREDDSDETGPSTGFTLSDLRQLHKGGKISDSELERAKAKIIEASKRASDRALLKPSTPKSLDRLNDI